MKSFAVAEVLDTRWNWDIPGVFEKAGEAINPSQQDWNPDFEEVEDQKEMKQRETSRNKKRKKQDWNKVSPSLSRILGDWRNFYVKTVETGNVRKVRNVRSARGSTSSS